MKPNTSVPSDALSLSKLPYKATTIKISEHQPLACMCKGYAKPPQNTVGIGFSYPESV